MKKVCLLVVLAMMFSATLAHATFSRLAGMGLQTWMLTDDSNMWLNPAYVKDQGGRAWWEMGNGGTGAIGSELLGNQWGGLSVGNRLFGAIGIFFGRPYNGITNLAGTAAPAIPGFPGVADDALTCGSFGPGSPLGGGAVNGAQAIYSMVPATPKNICDIFLGVPLFIPLAVRYNLAAAGSLNSYIYSSSPAILNRDGFQRNEAYVYEHNFYAGAHLGQLIPILPIEVFGSFGIPIVNNSYSESSWNTANTKYYSESTNMSAPGAFNVSAGARLPLEMIGLPFFIYGQYTINNLPAVLTSVRKTISDTTPASNFTMERTINKQTVAAGISTTIKFGEGLFVAAVGGNYIVTAYNAKDSDVTGLKTAVYDSYTYTGTVISLPISIAFEYPLFWGFVGRAGVTYTPTWSSADVNDLDYDASKAVTTTKQVTTPTLSATSVAVSVGLSKNITDALSFDWVLRQTGSTAPAYEGLLGMLATQMSVNWMFR